MSDNPDDPISLEGRRRKRAADAIMDGLQPAQTLMAKMADARQKRMDLMAELFGLEQPYNYEVLDSLLFACEEPEEPPFKLHTDIGWLWRGYLLAYNVASSIRGAKSHLNNPRYTDWTEAAAKILADADEDMDNLATRPYDTLKPLFSVPEDEHGELQSIVDGLSLFSDHRDFGRSHRYVCLVRAIISAVREPDDGAE